MRSCRGLLELRQSYRADPPWRLLLLDAREADACVPPTATDPRTSRDRFLWTLQGNRILHGAGKGPLAGPALVRLWPKWQVAQRLVKEIEGAVEKEHLTPLDGARTISAVAATLFGYDEFILREISPETLLATAPSRR
jgi:hypothetical protein